MKHIYTILYGSLIFCRHRREGIWHLFVDFMFLNSIFLCFHFHNHGSTCICMCKSNLVCAYTPTLASMRISFFFFLFLGYCWIFILYFCVFKIFTTNDLDPEIFVYEIIDNLINVLAVEYISFIISIML